MEVNTDGEIYIKIVRRTYDNEPTHWEVEAATVGILDGQIEGTAPTFYGVVDMVFDYISEIDETGWTKFDANARNK